MQAQKIGEKIDEIGWEAAGACGLIEVQYTYEEENTKQIWMELTSWVGSRGNEGTDKERYIFGCTETKGKETTTPIIGPFAEAADN